MTARKSITAIHVICSWACWAAARRSCSSRSERRGTSDAELAHSAYRLMRTEILVFGIPLSFIALFSGIRLGLVTNWGVLRYWWTTTKLVLIVLTIVSGALLIGPALDRRLDGDGSEWGLVAAVGVNVAMLATAAVLGVFKPGGRMRPAAGA